VGTKSERGGALGRPVNDLATAVKCWLCNVLYISICIILNLHPLWLFHSLFEIRCDMKMDYIAQKLCIPRASIIPTLWIVVSS
jgi:hypothetical protein